VRRLLAVLLVAFLGLPLVAATPPPSLYSKPNVIVFPFISNGSTINREASSTLATIIATSMANTGLVTVTPPPPATDRKDYLTVARANRSDYYVSGFISPLGAGVSIVEQVVSTATGIVVFSQSTQLNTYNEATSQGDDLANFVSHHANRGLAAIGTAPPAASPTPAASNGPEANLGKLFSRKKKPAAKASPTPAPKPIVNATAPAAALVNVPTPTSPPRTAAPASRPTPSPAPRAIPTPTPAPHTTPAAVAAAAATQTYAVLPVTGTADAALRELAETRLTEQSHGERSATAAAACAAHAVHAVLSGTLTVTPEGTAGGGNAKFELTASDCGGKTLWHQTHGGDATGPQGLQVATERAVDGAIGAYLNPPKRRGR
jgi:TolB-like protein